MPPHDHGGQRTLHLAADAVEIAAGNRPMQAERLVISSGRIRVEAA
jgi:hypothetical protein